MKRFLIKFFLIFLIFFACLEVISRFLFDSRYFYFLNTYNLPKDKGVKDRYKTDTDHVDYLFIGSSRVPSTINPKKFIEEDKEKIAVVAGRGYMPSGLHYLALQNKISKHPDYIRNANVFIEYPGSSIYAEKYDDVKYRVYEPVVKTDRAMPNLIIPHLTLSSFFSFLFESKNSLNVKLETTLLFFSSFYRTSAQIKEDFEKHNSPIFSNKKDNNKLATEGGIRNDNIEFAKQKAIEVALIDKKLLENEEQLTISILNESILAKFSDLVNANGGTLLLYKMPLHSIQNQVYKSIKARENNIIFEKWLTSRNIKVIYIDDFKYTDDDFPDFWHLSVKRRDEFTKKLYYSFKEQVNNSKSLTLNNTIIKNK